MPPKGSRRGPDGKWILPAPQSLEGTAAVTDTPQGKKRGAENLTGTATKDKQQRKSAGAAGSAKLCAEDAALVNVPEVRKALNQYVKDLATIGTTATRRRTQCSSSGSRLARSVWEMSSRSAWKAAPASRSAMRS
mmetsp:Transcript_70033/g.154930  ORF Transcript_70033/g.154930 Transcript_70033/m.154930 type:complete len:135 (+) Transcript_70033:65-469(+)